MKFANLPIAVATTLTLTACHSVGPLTVPRDRFDYSQAIGDSWKNQMLLNIVKLRYADVPIFVDVGQIVAGYSLETGVNLSGTLASQGAVQGDNANLGVSGKFTDRPTITYVPMTGGKYIQELLTPIPPTAIFSAMQSGWPADALLLLGVGSINGIRNVRVGSDGVESADPRFLRMAALFREAQNSGALSIRVRIGEKGVPSVVVAMRNPGASAESLAGMEELRQLLGLAAGVSEYRIVLGDAANDPGELAVQSRSLFGLLQTMALRVDVPAEQVREGRATPGLVQASEAPRVSRFYVSSTQDKPPDAYLSVHYRNRYFSIDDRDLPSKRSFALIMMLFALAEVGQDRALPVLTIPTS